MWEGRNVPLDLRGAKRLRGGMCEHRERQLLVPGSKWEVLWYVVFRNEW